jgi:membrane associated rhomboid family serine protease
MIPLSDDNPPRGKPYVVYGLVAVNVAVFLVQVIGQLMGKGLFDNWSMIPYSVVHDVRVAVLGDQLGRPLVDQLGRTPSQLLPGLGPHPQWITVFTSMFLHGGWLHIGANMLYLWVFGNNIEDALGHVKFLIFYLVCGVLATGAHIVMSGGLAAAAPIPHSGGAVAIAVSAAIPTVGASGAIAGVLGAYIVLYPRARINTLITLPLFWTAVQIPAAYVLGVWFVLQLTGWLGTGSRQMGGGVAYWAHIGGFVAGMLLILLLGGRKRTSRRREPPQSPWKEDKPYPFRPWK